MTPLEVYMWLKLDDVVNLLIIFNAILFTASIVLTGIRITFENDMDDVSECLHWYVKHSHYFVASLLTGLFLVFLIPSSKQYATIKVLPAIYESKAIQKDLPELYDVAVEFLKENLKPKTEDGK